MSICFVAGIVKGLIERWRCFRSESRERNAEISGAGTASAGLPGYAATEEE